jgi:hypothetical protein
MLLLLDSWRSSSLTRKKRGLSAGLGPAPGAVIIDWASAPSDLTPDFDIDLPGDVLEDDVLRMHYRELPSGAFADYFTHTLTAGDLASGTITVPGVSPLTAGDYEFRARLERAGANNGAWSDTVEVNLLEEALTYATAEQGMIWPPYLYMLESTAINTASSAALDVTGDKVAQMGFLHWEDGGSHTVSAAGGGAIEFRTGAVTFSDAGTNFRVGLQDVDLTTGGLAPRSDGTYDVSADFAGGGGGITANAWQVKSMTGGSGSKTMAEGALVAVMQEMQARAGADSVVIGTASSLGQNPVPVVNEFIDAAWTKTGNVVFHSPRCLIMADDGTYGRINPLPPMSTYRAILAFNSGSSPDERGMMFRVPWLCKGREVAAAVAPSATTADYEICFYSDPTGTPVLMAKAQITGETGGRGNAAEHTASMLDAQVALVPGVDYGITLRPTTANNINYAVSTLDSANARNVMSGGTTLKYITRSDNTGAFTAEATPTTMVHIGIVLDTFANAGA